MPDLQADPCRAPIVHEVRDLFQPSSCSGAYMPVQPRVMRPAAETQTISVMTNAAPPSALLPMCTRWKSLGMPSIAEYMSIAETITRFFDSRSRSRNGWNIGGVTDPSAVAVAHRPGPRTTHRHR